MYQSQNNDQKSIKQDGLNKIKVYPFFKKQIKTQQNYKIIQMLSMNNKIVAIVCNQANYTWSVQHLDLNGNILALVQLGDYSIDRNLHLRRIGEFKVVVLVKIKDSLQFFTWNLNNYQVQKTVIKVNMNFVAFMTFKQSQLICVILRSNRNQFENFILEELKQIFKSLIISYREFSTGQKALFLDGKQNQLTLNDRIHINFRVYSLHDSMGFDNQDQIIFNTEFNSKSYLYRSIVDMWQIDTHKLYLQVSVFIKSHYLENKKQSQLDELRKQEKYINYIWNTKTGKIKTLKQTDALINPHRIQFTNSIRNVSVYYLEGLSLKQRARQSRALFSLTGMPVNYQQPWQPIPVYFYNIDSKRVQGECFISKSTHKLIWSAYQPNILTMYNVFNSLALWEVPGIVKFDFSIEMYATAMLLCLIKKCDEDLLAQVCSLISDHDRREKYFVFQSTSPQ